MSEEHKRQDGQQEHLKRLILLAKEGDGGAFEQVYKDYYTPLFRYIFSRIKHKQEAEDMTQTVFVKIWTSIPTWNTSHTSPLAFFFTVARNTMIDYFRKSAHREIVSNELVNNSFEDSDTTDRESEDHELRQVLSQAIAQLSDEQQEIITLLYTNDLTYEEIASITGKRQDAIRQLHSRAIKKLRDLYQH